MKTSTLKRAVLFGAALAMTALAALSGCVSRPDDPSVTVETPRPTAEATLAPTPEPTPEPTPSPTPEPAEHRFVREALDSMTLEEKIGQLLLFGFAGRTEADAGFCALAKRYPVGNCILCGDNIDRDDGSGGFDTAKALIDSVNAGCPVSLPRIFAADVEGGSVVRFSWDPRIPSARSQGNMAPDEVRGLFFAVGKKLRSTGISLDLAPVMDVSSDPDGSFLGTRIISTDLDTVCTVGASVIAGLSDARCGSCAKHFPGHGSSTGDSHYSTPSVPLPEDELYSRDIAAFAHAIGSGVDCVMTAHVLYPALDGENIASLSPYIITGVLRETLGFDGVVISDDMRMQGLSSVCSPGEAAVRFVNAGGDMLLCGADPEAQEEVILALASAAENGTITQERIDESVGRVLELKLRLGLIEP